MNFRSLLPVALASALLRADEPAAVPEITQAELKAHVERLASEAWEGRGSGTAGERLATDYIAGQFARIGLEPAGEGRTFFQDVSMPGAIKVGKDSRFELTGAGGAAGGAAGEAAGDAAPAFQLDRDWRPFSLSSSGVVEGELVFAGYGIRAPELGYDDYAGLDVRGKIVVIFRYMPHGTASWRKPQVRGAHAPFVKKLAQAVERGAIGLVIANDPFSFGSPDPAQPGRRVRPDRVQRGSIGGGAPKIPFLHLTLAAARRLFPAAFGATPEELEAAIHRGDVPRPASRAGGRRARLDVAIERTVLTGRNVCGLLRAGAPDALDEIIVVGAHHDHLGRGGGGSLARTPQERRQIHNGADDNASGTAGLLEIAGYLAARRDRLRRSVLFVTFTGEERGLLGSRHFADHPTLPLAKMVAMFNLDMIGRLEGRKLFVGGVKTSPVFRPLLESGSGDLGVEVVLGDGGRAPSDNTSFYNKKMPVLFFFAGMHGDYHRPGDDADKIDVAGMAKIARLCAKTAEAVAQLPERPPFQRADSGGMGPPRAVLGIWGEGGAKGVTITRITPQGPAAKAGVGIGDVVVEIDGKATPDLASLQAVMAGRKIGEKVHVKILHERVPREVEITLGRG